jgi:hypothetical protein
MRHISILFAALFILTLSSCEKTYYCVCINSGTGIFTRTTQIQAKGPKGAGNICTAGQQSNETCTPDLYPPIP